MPSEFLLTSLVVVLIPGTGVIYTVSSGLFLGARASMAAAAGCTCGILPHLVASILGLSAILHLGALAFLGLKLAGTLYLLWLAWSMWRNTGSLALKPPQTRRSLHKVALRGFLINILNPKLTIFFFAFLPQFIAPESSSPVVSLTVMSAVFMAMTLAVFVLYGLGAHGVGRWLGNSAGLNRLLQLVCAAMFAALGIKLALSEN